MKTIKSWSILLLSLPLVANASLITDSIGCDGSVLLRCALPGQDSDGTNDATNTVGAGDEFDINNLNELTIFSIDVGDSSFSIRNVRAAVPDLSGFGTLALTDLDWVGMAGSIIGVSLVTNGVSTSIQGNTDGTSLDMNDVTFGADFVRWDMAHTHWDVGASATFTLETTHRVPEPGTFSLLGLGLLGLGFMRRKRAA